MKISVITVTYNSDSTIRDTLTSVARQTHPDVEHIIIDGLSKDRTLEVVGEFSHVAVCKSEKDKGIYDAMNKGISVASGDVIGILNSDDFFPNEFILSDVAGEFEDPDVDAVIGDIAFVNPENLGKIVRHYSGKAFHPGKFAAGYMPPHPSFYVRKVFYEKYGLYKLDYKIAADYELLIRFLYTNKVRFKYINKVMVYMRTGGVSNQSVKSRYILNKEIIRACAENGIRTNMLRLSLKYFNKVFEYITPMLSRKKLNS